MPNIRPASPDSSCLYRPTVIVKRPGSPSLASQLIAASHASLPAPAAHASSCACPMQDAPPAPCGPPRHWKSLLAQRYLARSDPADPAPAAQHPLVSMASQIGQLPAEQHAARFASVLRVSLLSSQDRFVLLDTLLDQLDDMPLDACHDLLDAQIDRMMEAIKLLPTSARPAMMAKLVRGLAAMHERLYDALPGAHRTVGMAAALARTRDLTVAPAFPLSQVAVKKYLALDLLPNTQRLAHCLNYRARQDGAGPSMPALPEMPLPAQSGQAMAASHSPSNLPGPGGPGAASLQLPAADCGEYPAAAGAPQPDWSGPPWTGMPPARDWQQAAPLAKTPASAPEPGGPGDPSGLCDATAAARLASADALVRRAGHIARLRPSKRLIEFASILRTITDVLTPRERRAPLQSLIRQIHSLPLRAHVEFLEDMLPALHHCIDSVALNPGFALKRLLVGQLAAAHLGLYNAMPVADRSEAMTAASEEVNRLDAIIALPASQWNDMAMPDIDLVEMSLPLARFHQLRSLAAGRAPALPPPRHSLS